MTWLGEYPEDFTTVVCLFTTHAADGSPVAPSTAFEAADVIIYKNGSATQKTTTNGITMTSPFDSIVGLHAVAIDTSNDTGDSGFWTSGGGDVFNIVLSPDTETVAGLTALKVIGQFGIELGRALRPTTAGRKLDVSTGGEAGVDWANVGSPTTTLNLSGTTVKTATDVETDTQDIQGRLPAALTGAGNIKADALAISGDTTVADKLEAWTDIWVTGTLPSQSGVGTGLIKLSDGVITFDTQWNGGMFIVTGGSGAGYFDVISDTVASTDLLTMGAGLALPVTLDNTTTFLLVAAPGLSAESTDSMVDAFWNEPRASHVVSGSFGEYMPSNVTHWKGTAVPTPNTAGVPLVDVAYISGDGTAADNMEAFFDGTGYAGTGNVIPAVTLVANVTGTIGGFSATALADLFDTDSGTTFAGAVDGSVVKEIIDGAIASVASTVWSEALPGAYSSGTAGEIVGGLGAAGTLTSGERNAIADAILARNIAGGSSSGRIVTDALRALRNRWFVAGGVYTVTEEDDTTVAWTSLISSDASAVPITGSDPA